MKDLLIVSHLLNSRQQRRAFTLVELLVVIAIIGILIGMLFPAVQAVRETSRRTACANKLEQFGTALSNFESTHEHFPSAYESQGLNPGWSWGTFILPHIEQENLYTFGEVRDRVFGDGANPASTPTEYSQTLLASFRCPSDLGPDLNPVRLNHGMSNYRAVAGPTTTQWFYPDWDFGGVLYQNSRTKIAEITDGTANTVVIGECMFEQKIDKRAALWPGMTGYRNGSVWISDVMWWIDEASAVINGPAPQAFSSRHPGGALFAFCDGSTRFFKDGGNVEILRFLGGRNDGTIVDLDF
jgi:prepilin-type N-terminal cleavage/methylation domain-containing protein/prepilin-type processing-associated H-X9-DG protein